MSKYIARHRRPRLAWRQDREAPARMTAASPNPSVEVAPAAVSLFAPTAKTRSA